MKYLLDTNTVSMLMKGNVPVRRHFEEAIRLGGDISISAICYYEIKRGLIKSNAIKQLEEFNNFCETYKPVLLDTLGIFDNAANIYAYLSKTGKVMGDADILIGSTALQNDFVVVTDNIKHFNRIKNLKVVNWKT